MWSTICPVLLALFENLLAGFIVLYGVYFYQQYRYWKHLKSKFNGVEFEGFYKEQPGVVVRTVVCTVKDNVIKYEGGTPAPLEKVGKFGGEFIINPINFKIGKGLHVQDNYDGF